MTLSNYQRSVLQRLRGFHSTGPTWGQLLRSYLSHWAGFALWLAIVSWLLPQYWMIFATLAATACAKDIGYMRTVRVQWPVTNAVIDWQRVDTLLSRTDQ